MNNKKIMANVSGLSVKVSFKIFINDNFRLVLLMDNVLYYMLVEF